MLQTDLSDRTVMEKISSSSSSSSSYAKLDGKVESDEFYIKAGLKKVDHNIMMRDNKIRRKKTY